LRHNAPTLLVGADGSGVEIDHHQRRSPRLDALEGMEPSTPSYDLLDDLLRNAAWMLHELITLVFGLVFQA
jgi:hypothetical protein